MLLYQELDEFVDALKAIDKIRPIFVTVTRATRESIVTGCVLVMAVDELGLMHSFNHSEDIPAVRLIPDDYFALIEDEKRRQVEYEEYKARFDVFEEALFKEYTKMRDVLKGLGFQKIYNAVSVPM